jgi:hypothetical protein
MPLVFFFILLQGSTKKRFFWAQICKTMMGFGHPFARMKNLTGQLAHIHTSTNIRVLLDNEHLAVHFAC